MCTILVVKIILSLDINILKYKFELILEYIDLIKYCVEVLKLKKKKRQLSIFFTFLNI